MRYLESKNTILQTLCRNKAVDVLHERQFKSSGPVKIHEKIFRGHKSPHSGSEEF